MLGVGLLILSFCAEISSFKSFTAILTLTLVSFLYTETHLLGITRMSVFLFQCNNLSLSYDLAGSTLLQIFNFFFHSLKNQDPRPIA